MSVSRYTAVAYGVPFEIVSTEKSARRYNEVTGAPYEINVDVRTVKVAGVALFDDSDEAWSEFDGDASYLGFDVFGPGDGRVGVIGFTMLANLSASHSEWFRVEPVEGRLPAGHANTLASAFPDTQPGVYLVEWASS